MRRNLIFHSGAMVIFPSTLVSILPVGGLFFRNGTLEIADFIFIIILTFGMIAPIITCFSYTDDLGKISSILGEVTSILEQEEMVRPSISTGKLEGTDIVLHDVIFGYHDKEVLHGINMNIKKGTVNALVGPSGSGKSTIAKLIAGLWDVTSGHITIGGGDLTSLEDQNTLIAYVAQDNYLFNMSIRENILKERRLLLLHIVWQQLQTLIVFMLLIMGRLSQRGHMNHYYNKVIYIKECGTLIYQ